MRVLLAILAFSVSLSLLADDTNYIVLLHKNAKIEDVVKDNQSLKHKPHKRINAFSSKLNPGQLKKLQDDKRVRKIEVDLVGKPIAQTIPAGIVRIGTTNSTTAKIDGTDERVNVGVAVIDQGIDYNHPDLNVVDGYSVTSTNANGQSYYTHGTECAGVIGALDNTIGVVGVAPGCNLYAVNFSHDVYGTADISDALDAFDWVTARATNIAVVNLSWQWFGISDALRESISNCVAAGIIVVVGAGNTHINVYGADGVFGTADDSIPQAYPEVITVSAMNDYDGIAGGLAAVPGSINYWETDDIMASWSNYGEKVEICAPGQYIYTTADIRWGDPYVYVNGTSFSGPHVAGVVALMVAKYGRQSLATTKAWLISNGFDQATWKGGADVGDPDTNKEPLVNADVDTWRVAPWYVSQSGSGTQSGVDAANAKPLSWFNDAANWGAGVGLIGSGDTVKLTGTITSAATIQASGSAGSPIRVEFDTGAKLSAATWTSSGALIGSSKNYIDIVGGTIESTANGGGLANQNDDKHIYLTSCNNWNITGLQSRNAYVANPASVDSNAYGTGFYEIGSSAIVVSNCVFANGGKIVMFAYTAGNSNISLLNSSISNCIVGVTVGSSGVNSTVSTVRLQGNTINIGTNWFGSWNGGTEWHHTDCVHLFTAHSGTLMGDVIVSGNTFGPYNPSYTSGLSELSNATAWLYVAGGPGMIQSPRIYNNVFSVATGTQYGPTVGLLTLRGLTNGLAANNTIVGNGARNGFYIYQDVTNATIANNIVKSCYVGCYDSGSTTPWLDYNSYYGNNSVGILVASFKDTLADWRTALGGCPGAGRECNSIATDPLLATNLRLLANSPCIGTGTNLNAYFTTDIAGVSRGSSWDIGAYEYRPVGIRSPVNLKGQLKIK